MFGKIINIEANRLTLENISKVTYSELMNTHVVFELNDRKTIGEIVKLDNEIIDILLVGEIRNNTFSSGVVKKPSSSIKARLINVDELKLIIGKDETNILVGKSAVYEKFNISVNPNDFFANHSAIIGNTGSGKSCGATRLLQNLFVESINKPINASFVLFDAYGEYSNAFNRLNEIGLGFKKYNTKVDNIEDRQLIFPANFLDVDDLAILLQVSDSSMIPVLENTLKLVYIFTSKELKVKDYKNDIIAKCLLDILTSGKNSSQMRDQIIAVLSHYNTDTLNLNTIIEQPGYNRTLKQCLNIDDQGKINAILLVTEFLQGFCKIDLKDIKTNNLDLTYSLDDIYYALEFALISEGTINSGLSYDKNNILRTRLQTIINSENKFIFKSDTYFSKNQFVENLFKINDKKAQIININLSNVDDRFAKIITKLYSKLLFTYMTELSPRASKSINIVLEEAHRYVQNDNDINIIGYNIFDRITKEGRKYGTLLTLITQRPSELSTTSISQCANFVVFRIFYPKDIEIVKSMNTNVTEETINRIKTLNPGTAFVFGTGFKMPLLVNFNLPSPMPESSGVNVKKVWY